MALSFNPEIKNEITENGGTIVYSTGNIIIASELSDELYNELLNSPYIESLEVLPLKRFSNLVLTNENEIVDDISNFEDDQQPSQPDPSTSGTSGGGNETGNASA